MCSSDLLEPLTFAVDERHEGDGNAECGRGEAGETIEPVFLGRIEQPQRAQGLYARFFCKFLLTEHEHPCLDGEERTGSVG